MTVHGWAVALIVEGSSGWKGGTRCYRPWCECGWENGLLPVELEAAEMAYTHATGRNPTTGKPPRTWRGRFTQSERIFNPEEGQ